MVASEMFLDSAVKLDSVVSHAKELNYIPNSAKSATAEIEFTLVSNHSPVSIPKGTLFSGQNSNGNYTFTTSLNQNFISSSSTYKINLQIHEGFYIQDSFVMDYTQESQRFVLSNPNIDIDSLNVYAVESGTNTDFSKVETTFNLNEQSNVFFLQAAQNNQYEIIFGDGLLGRVPDNLSTIVADYRVTNGAEAQDISSFLLLSDLGVGITNISTINTISNSIGGSGAETIESIRKFAPRYFATQERAVASEDYASIILNKFQGQVESVNVYGGQELNPKKYGRVAVCVKPTGGLIAPDYIKNQILIAMQNYVGLPTRVVIVNPEYLYITVNADVQYNVSGTTKYASEIKAIITSAIKQFSVDHIETFNGDFRYSKFVAHIDNSDTSITSNNTEVRITKRVTPKLNYTTSFVLDFNNPTEYENVDINVGYLKGDKFYDEPVVTSSAFSYITADGTLYDNCFIRDDNYGTLAVYKIIDGKFIVLNSFIGLVDYTKGLVTITNFSTPNYGSYLSIMIVPKNKDIIANKDKILMIDLADVTVSVMPTQK
jgi:hypothetical protein